MIIKMHPCSQLTDCPSCDFCMIDETSLHYFVSCQAYSGQQNIFINILHAQISLDMY